MNKDNEELVNYWYESIYSHPDKMQFMRLKFSMDEMLYYKVIDYYEYQHMKRTYDYCYRNYMIKETRKMMELD